ncbi:hypothetical protein PIB30_069633 [Stylosanthes scabra]|uniref:Uncharacterized protein n=1 Tax=Stylosanthes scabra TaxID=79078 RepID=A0ABU6RNI1_9FABA|nr:hypothetical protein [Stylosanthes scabra]
MSDPVYLDLHSHFFFRPKWFFEPDAILGFGDGVPRPVLSELGCVRTAQSMRAQFVRTHLGVRIGLEAFLHDFLVPFTLFSHFYSNSSLFKPGTLEQTNQGIEQNEKQICRGSAESTQKGGTGCFGVAAIFARREPCLGFIPSSRRVREDNRHMRSRIIYYEIEKHEKYKDSDEEADSDLAIVKTRRYHLDPDRLYELPIESLLTLRRRDPSKKTDSSPEIGSL